MIDLDALIERARSATVHRAAAEQYVRELERRVPEAPPARRWPAWLAAGLGAAAAAALVLWLISGRAEVGPPVAVGERVAIVIDPDTAYRVVQADADATSIEVAHGAVTARLWPGARPHRLALSGGGVTAVATGTVYSLAVRADGAVVSVAEGTVEVEAGGAVHAVRAGETWPAGGKAVAPSAGRKLLALSAPPVESAQGLVTDAAPDDTAPIDAAPDAMDADAAVDAGAPDAAAPDAAAHPMRATHVAPSIKERWRTARLRRSQGQFTEAVAECLAIADARDPVWSPIALVEAVQIELHQLADSERAIALADRMLRDWPADALAPEARDLRCRALRQIGRGGECAATPQP